MYIVCNSVKKSNMTTNYSQTQQVVWCKYCNPQRRAEYHCQNCGDPLCSECGRNHLSYPHFTGHQVVSIKDRLPSLEPCWAHPKYRYELACRECEIPICNECRIQSHLQHRMMPLSQLLEKSKTALTKEISEMKTSIKPKLKDLIQNASLEEDKVYQEIEDKMTEQATMFTNKIENILKNRIEHLREMREDDHSYIEYSMNLISMRDELDKVINDSEKALETFSPTEMIFFHKHNSYIERFRQIKSPFRVSFPSFKEGNLEEAKISDMFGNIIPSSIDFTFNEQQPETRQMSFAKAKTGLPRPKSCENMTKQPEFKRSNTAVFPRQCDIATSNTEKIYPELICEFSTPYPHLYHIAYYENNKIFVTGFGSKSITFLDLSKGRSEITIKTGLEEVFGLTVAWNGDLYYSDPHECCVVRAYGKNYSCRQRMFKTGHEPWGLQCTKYGDILVCLIPFPVLQQCEEAYSMVVKYDCTGSQKLRIYWDQKKKEYLFESPRFVCENTNNDICVSDTEKRRIIVVNDSGLHRFSYTGNEFYGKLLGRTYSEFSPHGIDSDWLGNIFVADTENNNVHQLDKDGHFIRIILSSVDRLIRPWSIRADKHGRLWVIHRNATPNEITTRAKVLVYKRVDVNIERNLHMPLVRRSLNIPNRRLNQRDNKMEASGTRETSRSAVFVTFQNI